jgi:predicted phosphodiesterase
MARGWARTAGVGTCATALVAVAVFHYRPTGNGPKPDLKPSAHWVFDSDGVTGNKVADRAGKLTGTILGAPRLVTGEPTPRLEFTTPSDGVLVKDRVPPDAEFLPPAEALSLVAWVRIDEPTEWGGIVGCMQDNGLNESGFLLGYNREAFYFALATKQAKRLTYLTGKTKYERGKWYHVAGVYDGKRMRLYVNGKPDGESAEQTGPVLYAKAAPLVIGRYRDDDEDFPLAGAIREVMLCPHAVAAEQVAAHFEADKALADEPSVIPPGPRFVVEPYLQYATRTTMTVMWETEAPCTAVVEYGTKFPLRLAAKVEKPGAMGEVVLSNLEPATKYFYRVVCTDAEGRRLEGPPRTFQTASGPNDAFSFTVIGDTQRNPVVTAKVAKLMWERRPNFVIHCGDVVDDGPAKWQWTGDLFKPCSELFGRVPVYPCIGNHEKNHDHYYKYFSLPGKEYYYSFKYGNAEFFVLDTNGALPAPRNLTESGEQYKWLDKALAASEAKWKFCYHHHPAYSSDDNDFGNSWAGPTTSGDTRLRHFVKLYEKYNVDVVFNGHIHVYERTWPIRDGKVDQKAGVTYVTSGGGGGRLENFAPTPAFFKQEFRSDFHFCYATVHQGTFNLKVFDHEGRLFDQFALKKQE